MEAIRRIFKAPKQSFFLFGPRGTGKSTLIRAAFPDAIYIDLLQPETFRSLSARPERLREYLLGNPGKTTIIVDEIQKVPDLLDLIHSLIEERTGLQFILTGSSSRKLKRSGVDLLAGRALLCNLHPFIVEELQGQFSLENALRLGFLPVVLDSNDPGQVLKTYIALYIREEVQFEGLVRNIGNFSRFLEAVSFSHASVLNISNISRECEVERKVVENYISVLEDLLLCYRLKVFTKRAKRALVSHPKFYLFDTGVYRSLRPKGPLDRPEEIDGHALEGLIGQHLRAWIDYSNRDYSMYFWRTRSGVEVDFVVYGPGGIFAIEIKNSARINPGDLRSLKHFKEDYPESKLYFVYRGKKRLLKNDILCIPCNEFLFQLRVGDENFVV